MKRSSQKQRDDVYHARVSMVIGIALGAAVVLTIMFSAMKMAMIIEWPWWIVISPLALPTSIYIVALVVFVVYGFMKPLKPIAKEEAEKHRDD